MSKAERKLIRMAKVAGMNTANDMFFQASVHDLGVFAALVAEECANVSPAGLDVTADLMPHRVWEKFQSGIRAKFPPAGAQE